ncbi:MAG: hypothetical protein ACO28O_04505 [Crocinitomicaceae bacterium]|jgi:tetrahydromethanopterin S-methyltransferase subunit E
MSIQNLQKVRVFENSHIVFWLFKDMSWAMGWKWLGIAMIIPTLFISILITYKLKVDVREWYHNNAVTLWIIANSYWMISEFYGFDDTVLFENVKGIHISLIPFVAGIFVVSFYYLFKRKRDVNSKNPK